MRVSRAVRLTRPARAASKTAIRRPATRSRRPVTCVPRPWGVPVVQGTSATNRACSCVRTASARRRDRLAVLVGEAIVTALAVIGVFQYGGQGLLTQHGDDGAPGLPGQFNRGHGRRPPTPAPG